jgi:hypothetical protein
MGGNARHVDSRLGLSYALRAAPRWRPTDYYNGKTCGCPSELSDHPCERQAMMRVFSGSRWEASLSMPDGAPLPKRQNGRRI